MWHPPCKQHLKHGKNDSNVKTQGLLETIWKAKQDAANVFHPGDV